MQSRVVSLSLALPFFVRRIMVLACPGECVVTWCSGYGSPDKNRATANVGGGGLDVSDAAIMGAAAV